MNTEDTQSLTEKYIVPTYGRFPFEPVRGEGTRIWDTDGKEYLDFGAGIAVCSLGHCPKVMVEAITKQAGTLIHCSNLYQIRDQALLAQHISDVVMELPGKTFFANSGAEANEAMVKLARKFGSATGRHEIITFEMSFHGRTMTGISATGQEKVKTGFAPLLPGFKHLPFNDIEALRSGITKDTIAIMMEPIQGEGGIHCATPEFLEAARDLCAEHDLLLLFDEVQSGLGRTGDLCAWRSLAPNLDIRPHAVSWAKGMGGGYPIGATWISSDKDLCDILGPGTHGTTYGGGPLSSAVALAVLREVSEAKLPENSAALGSYILEAVSTWDFPKIKEVRGLGLMIGFQLEGETGIALATVKALMEHGLITIPAAGEVVRLLPPLNVTREEVDQALAILKDTFASL